VAHLLWRGQLPVSEPALAREVNECSAVLYSQQTTARGYKTGTRARAELNAGAATKEGARPAQALKALQNLADAAEHEGPRLPARKHAMLAGDRSAELDREREELLRRSLSSRQLLVVVRGGPANVSPAPGLAVRVDEERVDSVVVRLIRKRGLLERGFEPVLDFGDLRDHLVERALAAPDRHHV
jgi:hypothetical protein